MTRNSILCNLLFDVFSTHPLQTTQGWIAWVNTALLEHSPGDGACIYHSENAESAPSPVWEYC